MACSANAKAFYVHCMYMQQVTLVDLCIICTCFHTRGNLGHSFFRILSQKKHIDDLHIGYNFMALARLMVAFVFLFNINYQRTYPAFCISNESITLIVNLKEYNITGY